MCLSVGLYGESCTDAGCNSCYSKYVKQYVLKKSELDLFGIDDEPLFVAKGIVEKNSPNEYGSVINYKELAKRLKPLVDVAEAPDYKMG